MADIFGFDVKARSKQRGCSPRTGRCLCLSCSLLKLLENCQARTAGTRLRGAKLQSAAQGQQCSWSSKEHGTSTECVCQMLGFRESVPDEARHCASLRSVVPELQGIPFRRQHLLQKKVHSHGSESSFDHEKRDFFLQRFKSRILV